MKGILEHLDQKRRLTDSSKNEGAYPVKTGTLTLLVSPIFGLAVDFCQHFSKVPSRFSYVKLGPGVSRETFLSNLRIIRSEPTAVYLWLTPSEVRGSSWDFYMQEADRVLELRDGTVEVLKDAYGYHLQR